MSEVEFYEALARAAEKLSLKSIHCVIIILFMSIISIKILDNNNYYI